MKILALVDDKGSRFHRLIVPLSLLPRDKYEVNFVKADYVTESLVQRYDIVMCLWLHRTNLVDLSLWRERYGFKFIQDVDDYWRLPLMHSQKKIVDSMAPRLMDQFIFADKVICATS